VTRTELPVGGNTIGSLLRHWADERTSHIALVDGERRMTFGELDVAVEELAQGLATLGVARGGQVALWMTNCAEWILCWFACARLGATLVTVNTRYKAQEVEYILRQSEAGVLIMMDRYWSIDYTGMLREIAPELGESSADGVLHAERVPALRHVILWRGAQANGATNLDTLAARGRQRLAAHDRLPPEHAEDPVIIVYTSGTTGKPKGAMHSHVFLRNCVNMSRWMRSGPDDVFLGHMPFYHVAGAFAGAGQWLVTGGTLVTVPHWVTHEVLDVIERERVSIFGGIPTHYIDCIDAIKERPRMIRMKCGWIGGANVTREVATEAVQALGLQSLQAVYGMTETTSMTTLSGFDAPFEITCENKGRPIGDFEVKVCDPQTGVVRPVGEIGEVWVRGHIVMLGYYKNPEATAEALTSEGWFRTGDLGVFDRDGFLQITGRLRDMFIVGGTNTYPAEIEAVLQQHAAVKLAVVVGVPHPRLGEVGFAYVQLHEGSHADGETLTAHCSRALADYKVPRQIRIVDEFPRTTTGKIQRHVLVSAAAEQSLRPT
jgi:fatty-acyl-CoA synthase